jgi:alpha-beta hydrolase superfamily lysophospholipase
MAEEKFDGEGGLQIFVRSWRPAGPPRGVVAIVPGFGGSQFFYDTAGPTDKTIKLYTGHVHDLLNDIDKELVMSDITGWIDARL